MNTVGRQLFVTLFISTAVFIIELFLFLFTFPLPDWQQLWNQKIMDIPFILFALLVSVIIGSLFGLLSGSSIRKQFQLIIDGIYKIELGDKPDIEKMKKQDLDPIANKLEKLHRYIVEQTKLSQKLVDEKAEDVEKRTQDIISEERNRLARELHDSVSQQLFAASMMMSAINETNSFSTNEPLSKQLKMVEEMIHQSQLEMRALLLHLRPVALKGKSLPKGIKELLSELTLKVPLKITSKIEEMTLSKGIEDHLFRILQESISNTLRHAKATALEVLLIKRDGFVILRVIDDGVGFDVEASNSGSYGLQNMYERAIEIGGTLKIISLKEQGTRLEVKVPIVNEGVGEESD